MDARLTSAIELTRDLLAASNVDEGHGIVHAQKVLGHALLALELEDDGNHQAICLAALLHDVDDSKFFPHHKNYENARLILSQLAVVEQDVELIIHMISLVSCSKNGNTPVAADNWMLIPRYADRLEALGYVGIYRCYIYTSHKGLPLFTDRTPRATTEADLAAIATPERFERYAGKSDSFIDHFYDKILHLVNADIRNDYLRAEANARHRAIVDLCLHFGRTGEIDMTFLSFV